MSIANSSSREDHALQWLRPTGRIKKEDEAFSSDLRDVSLNNYQFVRLVGITKRFDGVSFKNCTFDACYLRDCTFSHCDFTGCRFTSSVLLGSSFFECNFQYAIFDRTIVDKEILTDSKHSSENIQWRFARTLRVNFHQIGDTEAVNIAIQAELRAQGIHLYKAWRSDEPYYRRKYQGWSRIRHFASWTGFRILHYVWGNGEGLLNILASGAVLLIVIALFTFTLYPGELTFKKGVFSILVAPQMLVGTANANDFPRTAITFLTLIRLIWLAMFGSVLIRRWVKR